MPTDPSGELRLWRTRLTLAHDAKRGIFEAAGVADSVRTLVDLATEALDTVGADDTDTENDVEVIVTEAMQRFELAWMRYTNHPGADTHPAVMEQARLLEEAAMSAARIAKWRHLRMLARIEQLEAAVATLSEPRMSTDD